MPQTINEAGPALQDLVSRAIDVGIQGTSPDGPVIPFVLAQVDDAVQMHRIMLGEDADGDANIDAARTVATSIQGIERAAFVWDGFMRLDGARRDAILVLAQERGDEEACIVGQPYVWRGGEAIATGDVVLLSRDEEPLIDLPRAVSPHHDDWAPPAAPSPGPTSALRERLLRCRPDEDE